MPLWFRKEVQAVLRQIIKKTLQIDNLGIQSKNIINQRAEEKSKHVECSRERCRDKSHVLGASLQEAVEDHLGAALIRSGDSVIIIRDFPKAAVMSSGGRICARENESGWNHGKVAYRP